MTQRDQTIALVVLINLRQRVCQLTAAKSKRQFQSLLHANRRGVGAEWTMATDDCRRSVVGAADIMSNNRESSGARCLDHRPASRSAKALILLSQKVAAIALENRSLRKIHSSACEGLRWFLQNGDDSGSRFSGYVEGLVSVIGHADRAGPLRDYCVGLMLPCERKSVEPMAAVTAPDRTAAQHQSLLHFVGNAGWSDEKVLAKVSAMVLPEVERHGPIEAWIIDDTGFPKQGRHSVGVARQYCGQLGKQDNCQVAVSLSVANRHASLPVAYRLYLPQDWAKDRARRRKVGVPKEIVFKTKPQIALEQLRWACEAGLPRGVVLMDACFANSRTGISVSRGRGFQ